MKSTSDRLHTIRTKLEAADETEQRLRLAKEDAQDAKWELLYALISEDPHLAAKCCTVSKAKLRRALRGEG